MNLKTMNVSILVLLGALVFSYCQKEVGPGSILPPKPLFDSVPVVKPLTPLIPEISGIADSKANPGIIWGHEDSGRPPQVYLVQHDGSVVKKIHLNGITNRDWEDMVLVNNEIFIGEIGDNASAYTNYKFYRFAEPAAATDTVHQIEAINFTYPDGSHDAEAFLVDASTRDIFIITKRDNPSRIYKLAYPYQTNNVVSLEGSLPYMGVVSAAVSPNGKEIIVKTYTGLYHYQKKPGESLAQALQKPFTKLHYTIEPQGEAICFAQDDSGFFTLSEKGFSSSVNVYFYKRN